MNSKFFKELILTFGLLVFMLLPGAILDFIYLKRYEYEYAERIVACLCSKLKPLGITYTSAFSIMSNNVGVLLAMVSLFLTMNINIAQRSEKKIMGIPYREIEDINYNELYKVTKRISYLAPILMLFVLNMHLCVTGYLLFCYCYGFLIMYYYFHASSFSMKWSRKKVVKRLIKCLLQEKEWNYDGLREYDMYLEEVGRGIEEEGNWKEAELLYDNLNELSNIYKAEQRQILLSHFYKIVYWNRKSQNIPATFRLWNMSMEKIDVMSVKNKQISECDWVLLWAMLKIIIYEAKENELLIFLKDFMQFKLRSKKTLETVGEELPEKVLFEQSGVVIVLLEYRLREKLPEQANVERCFKELVNFGDKAFLIQDYHIMDTIQFLCDADEKTAEDYLQIVKELRMDFKNRTTRCIISNIVMN